MLTELDAMTVVAKQLPEDGITYREFVTRAVKLCGESDDVIEAAIKLAEQDGIMADDIVRVGPSGSRLN